MIEFADEIAPRKILKPEKDISRNYIIDDSYNAQPKTISSQTFQAASQCLLKGRNILYGTEQLQPSAEAKENHMQGHIFESLVFKAPQKWIPKISKALKIDIPTEIKRVNCEVTTPDIPIEELINKSISKTKTLITEHLLENVEQPALFRQVTLGSREKDGRADIVIYTGAPEFKWIVGDIKRSEECMTTFGVQLFFYKHLLEPLIADILQMPNEELAEAMHHKGIIIHYAKGYTFSNKSSKREQELCLNNLVVTDVEMDLLKDEFEELYKDLNPESDSSKPNMAQCKFGNYCIDCQFRQKCYQTLVKADRVDISMVPMDAAVLEVLKDLGVHSAEDLVSMNPNHPILMDLLEKPDRVAAFIHRAKKTITYNGYSNWMFKPEWDERVWFYASRHDAGQIETIWKTPEGKYVDTPSTDTMVVATFTEAERMEAYYRLQTTMGNSAREVEFITILDDLRNFVHLPLPSYTLHALAKFFKLLRSGKKPREILKDWFEHNHYRNIERMEQDVEEKMENIVEVWLGLTYLSKQFHL